MYLKGVLQQLKSPLNPQLDLKRRREGGKGKDRERERDVGRTEAHAEHETYHSFHFEIIHSKKVFVSTTLQCKHFTQVTLSIFHIPYVDLLEQL